MKIRSLIIALPLLTLPFLPVSIATAQGVDVKSPVPFKGVAKVVVMQLRNKQVEMRSEYPQFLQNTPVTRLANWKIRTVAQSNYRKFLETVKRDFAPGANGGYKPVGPYQFEQESQLTYYYAPRLISTTKVFYEYAGGAHGMNGTVATNFGQFPGMARPRVLTLGDFFTGTAYRKTIEKKIIDSLRANKQQEATWILDGTVKSLTSYQLNNFTVSPTGLTWYFEPYAVGPYVAGEFEVTLPINQLTSDFKRAVVMGR